MYACRIKTNRFENKELVIEFPFLALLYILYEACSLIGGIIGELSLALKGLLSVHLQLK